MVREVIMWTFGKRRAREVIIEHAWSKLARIEELAACKTLGSRLKSACEGACRHN